MSSNTQATQLDRYIYDRERFRNIHCNGISLILLYSLYTETGCVVSIQRELLVVVIHAKSKKLQGFLFPFSRRLSVKGC